MLLIKLNDGVPEKFPVTLENFLLLHPSTSFPGYLDASITEPLGFGIYTFTQVPSNYDKATEIPDEDLPVRNDETGIWEQKWIIRKLTDTEKSDVDTQQRLSVISQRNMLLASTDWTQIGDAPLSLEKKAQWAAYRQELRDLLNVPNFDIWKVIWPTQPSPEINVEQAAPNVIP